MICFFNGQGSQPIQPFLPQAAPQVDLNEFQFRKGSLGCCPVTCNVRNNSRAVHTLTKVCNRDYTFVCLLSQKKSRRGGGERDREGRRGRERDREGERERERETE